MSQCLSHNGPGAEGSQGRYSSSILFFCDRAQRRLGLGSVRIDLEAVDLLYAYPWPGNVRELENVISRAVLKASFQTPRSRAVVIRRHHLGGNFAHVVNGQTIAPKTSVPIPTLGSSLRNETKKFQIRMIRAALARSNGNWAAAARLLGMHRSNLHNFAARLGIR